MRLFSIVFLTLFYASTLFASVYFSERDQSEGLERGKNPQFQ